MKSDSYLPVLKNIILFCFTFFAATFFMVEKMIAFIHIQLGVLLCLNIAYAIISKSIPDINRVGKILFISMSGMWCCFLLSVCINNEWQGAGIRVLNSKIWLLILPFIFSIAPKFSRKEYIIILTGFVAGIFTLSTITVVRFFLLKAGVISGIPISFDSIIEPVFIPFLIFHHTVCVYLALCLVVLHFIYTKWNDLLNRFIRISMAIIAFCIVIYIVLISARIGFIALGAIFFVYGLIYFFTLNIAIGHKLLLVIGSIITLTFFLWLSPTAKKRLDATREEIRILLSNQVDHNQNFSARIIAYKVGTSLLMKQPLTGVSFINENDLYIKEYNDLLGIKPDQHPFAGTPIKPHTQFYRYMVIVGIPVGILLICFYLLPFLTNFKLITLDFKLFYFVFTLYTFTDFPFDLKEVFYMFCFMIPLWGNIEYASLNETRGNLINN